MALTVRGPARGVLLGLINAAIAKIARDDESIFPHRRKAMKIRLAK
jgi:hypothetical protein